ncbi:hypothetical protein BDB00DRAFT_861832 [Zychaea mexicana]|uniref:uncharacterized protein n=1 Tax=Zychaea mexicana TaxID=64656 RepID=UPI0022FE7D65|nr:uncharacterized protein BDB00DRAFT_861832 [Zychaea mexicana]KAI9471419.1 hypothetical protein BDB00DRAFT_861832 [Zychaea mexicana]
MFLFLHVSVLSFIIIIFHHHLLHLHLHHSIPPHSLLFLHYHQYRIDSSPFVLPSTSHPFFFVFSHVTFHTFSYVTRPRHFPLNY